MDLKLIELRGVFAVLTGDCPRQFFEKHFPFLSRCIFAAFRAAK
jgi:hypothetical protein